MCIRPRREGEGTDDALHGRCTAGLHNNSWDTYFVCCANLASTLFYVYFEPSGEALVANLNLSFVSFIIIMPVTALITHAFTRREFSYQSISRLKGVSPHAAAREGGRRRD